MLRLPGGTATALQMVWAKTLRGLVDSNDAERDYAEAPRVGGEQGQPRALHEGSAMVRWSIARAKHHNRRGVRLGPIRRVGRFWWTAWTQRNIGGAHAHGG